MPLDANQPDFWTEALQFTPTIHRDVYPAINPSNEDIQQTAHGKLVLITGGGGGFGKGAAKQWAAANASAIVLAARTQQSIDEVAESLKTTGSTTQFLPIATDVSSETDVHNLLQRALGAFVKIDVVVHCAGVLGPLEPIGDAPVDEWWRSFNVHPGMAPSKVLRPELHIYAKDTVELFGSLTIYLSGPKEDFLKNRFIATNWDVTDLEKHQDEIVAEGLLKSQAFKGDIGPGGHKFKS
ncbi:hypothetical protein V8C34DRAFT_169584 [Trichoderma compactum]